MARHGPACAGGRAGAASPPAFAGASNSWRSCATAIRISASRGRAGPISTAAIFAITLARFSVGAPSAVNSARSSFATADDALGHIGRVSGDPRQLPGAIRNANRRRSRRGRRRQVGEGRPGRRSDQLGELFPPRGKLGDAGHDRGRRHEVDGLCERSPRRLQIDPAAPMRRQPARAKRALNAARRDPHHGRDALRRHARHAAARRRQPGSGRRPPRRGGREHKRTLRRRPALDDGARGAPPIVDIVSAQQQRGDGGALLRRSEGDMAVCVGGDLAVPARALDAPVIVELDAAGRLARFGAERPADRGDRRHLQRQGAFEAPIVHGARLRLIGGAWRRREHRRRRDDRRRRLVGRSYGQHRQERFDQHGRLAGLRTALVGVFRRLAP